jgi:hypothetical protein
MIVIVVFMGLFSLLHVCQLALRQVQEKKLKKLDQELVYQMTLLYKLSLATSQMALLVHALTAHVVDKVGPMDDGETQNGNN